MSRDFRLYLEDILEAVEIVRVYIKGMSKEGFAKDRKTVDAVVRNLEIIGEAVKNLPSEIKSDRPEIQWRRIGGMRDILAHEYFGVNINIVWDVATNKLPELEIQVREILEESK